MASGVTHRRYGPLHRLDPHTPPPQAPAQCPDGRSVLYVAGNLTTALGEVFGDLTEAPICPNYRVALLRPQAPLNVLDIRSQGTAMRVGALPSLATGAYPRARTQQWARAIYEDQPVARRTIRGIYYNAAHTNGPALALWNTEDTLEVIRENGADQDFALADSRAWQRVAVKAAAIGLRVELIARCSHCP